MRLSQAAADLSVPLGDAGVTASHSCGEAADHLSALPDDLLRRIVSSLKAWEVVRTCVLARRWRHLWASAACLDLRTRYPTRGCAAPENLRGFVHRLLLSRDASAPVDTLRLRSSDMMGAFSDDESDAWVSVVMRRNARVIHVVGHRRFPAPLEGVSFVSCHLKVLKLSYARLDGRILGQLSSSCASLEELDLKDCLVTDGEIVSASLKTLIMLSCKTSPSFSVAAPNLLHLRIIRPYARVPTFRNLGSLVTGTILIDDYFLSDDFSEDDAYEETTDDDDCEHITDQEDGDETTDDDNSSCGCEHIIDQEDGDETTDDDNSSCGCEHITDQENGDDDDDSNYGSEHIVVQQDCDETTDADDDNSNHGSEHITDQDETTSEHIIDQEDCDENTDDDSCSYVSEHITDKEDRDETIDDEGDDNSDTGKIDNNKIDDDSGYISEDDDSEENIDEEDGSDNSKNSEIGYGRGAQKDNYDHDSDIDSDDNTYEYSEIAKEAEYCYQVVIQKSSKDANYSGYESTEINDSEYLGGQNILRSLSNVTSLGLLTDAREVVLSRELKRCPTFSNLKTLSLGECLNGVITADFDAVIILLQHSPNIEGLFLQLKLKQEGLGNRRVHKLANLFVANGIPLEKILVRRTGSSYLRAQEMIVEAMHHLMPFGPKWTHTKYTKFLERSSLVTEIRL